MLRQRIILLFFLLLSLKAMAQSPEWSAAGMPLHGRQVRCIYNDTANDVLYVTGEIMASSTSFSTQFICKYNGSTWSTIGIFNGQVLSVANYNGNLIAAGFFNSINGVPIFSIAQYDGSTWHSMGNFDDGVYRVKVIDTDLFALGSFNSIDGVTAKRIAKWNGSTWSDVYGFSSDTLDGILFDVAIYNGNTYVCGNFSNSTLGINHLAVYKAGAWQNVGGGILGSWTNLVEFAIYRNELYLAGSILKPAGNVGHGIQKWNDTIWSEVGSGVQDWSNGYGFAHILDITIHNNELYAAGGFGYAGHIQGKLVAKWDGVKWCGLATGNLFNVSMGAANALGFYNDTLYLAGIDDTINGVYTNRLIKYTAGSYVDTCSINFTGIEELLAENNLVLYPNPAQSTLTIQLSEATKEELSIEIKNMLGQTLQTLQLPAGNKQLDMDVSRLAKGIYFVQCQSKDVMISKKFIKQ